MEPQKSAIVYAKQDTLDAGEGINIDLSSDTRGSWLERPWNAKEDEHVTLLLFQNKTQKLR